MRCLICLRFSPRCGRYFLVWGSRVYSVGLIFDAAEMRKTGGKKARSLAEDERKPASTFAISPMPRLLTFAGFAPACIPAQFMLPWRIKQLFPSMPLDALTIFMLNNVYLLRGKISFHLTARVGACNRLPSGSPQHDASCVTPTDLIFPGHISACCCLQAMTSN